MSVRLFLINFLLIFHNKQLSKVIEHCEIEHQMKNKTKKDYQEFYRNPNKHIPINEMGDLYLRWFNQRYAALRMIKNLPIFEKAFKLLTERGNFSRRNAFGEMHCDGYLWVMKHEKVKVIVEVGQSHKHIFINDGFDFHIRALSYDSNYPAYRRNELKGITEKKFKEQGFEPYCPEDYESGRFGAFTYGDGRDDGYILSIKCLGMADHAECDFVNNKTIGAIERMEYWEKYLDNPEELE